jgi:hypothetical protein
MSKRLATSIFALTLTLTLGSRSAGLSHAGSQSGASAGWHASPQGQGPSEDEIRARTKILLANQHNDDEALDLYERVERHVDRTGGENPRTLDDKTYRVVPTGGGTQKVLIRDEGKPIDPVEYSRQLKTLEDVLQTMADPNDPKAKAAYAKYDKRKAERVQFVDAASEAYRRQWLRREIWNGRDCDVFELDPNPNFQPRSMFQAALIHVKATIWVDRETNHLAKGEASVISDVSFGGGIIGKLYRGSHVSMEQAEVAPGIWLPTRYQYDFSGRKFLFSFDQHQLIEITHYRRVGAPKEALQIVQSEVTNGKTFDEDP